MRVPGCAYIVGILALIGMTALCAVFAYAGTRQVVIDLSDRGVQVESPWEAAQMVLNARNGIQPVSAVTRVAFDNLPTFTPSPSAAPQTATDAPPTATLRPDETRVPTALPTAEPTLDVAASYEWDDPRRITILLMGIDQRTGVNEQGPYRTDTMMLVSIDPVRQSAGVLSIPRDLWVRIPGSGSGRINTANSIGEAQGYPGGGGPALAMDTVEENLGIRVDKYLLVNFDVFLTVVNTVAPDGVEVCIDQEIDDPHYPDAGYGMIHVHFDPGCQTLDAERLLQFARTRATQGADFDRAHRQQQVLTAVREQLLNAGGVSNFIAQAPALYDELSDSFQTNLTLEEIIGLGILAQDIPRENIRFGVIDSLYVQPSVTATGEQVLVPQYSMIRFLLQQVFNPQDDLTLADLASRAQAEGASIVVFNNTEIAGLASQTRDWLISRGVQVESVGNMPEITNSDTMIRVYRGKLWTAQYLAALFGVPSERIQSGAGEGLTSADIMVVVGPDVQELLTAQPQESE